MFLFAKNTVFPEGVFLLPQRTLSCAFIVFETSLNKA